MKALFLDRDGVINEDNQDYTWRYEDFRYIPHIFDLCRIAHSRGYRILVVTNQGGIAKGLYTTQDVEVLHQRVTQDFANRSIPIAQFYYCPHHPVGSRCLCRKPERLLFERAIAQHRLSATQCWMLGDRARDLEPARQLGMRTVMVGTEHTPAADYTFSLTDEWERIAALLV